MADEGGEKTELPTPKKLRDARKKGQVCTSKDVVSTALLVVLGVMLTDDISNLLRFIGQRVGENDVFAVREAGNMALLPMCYGTLDDIYPILKVVLKNLAVYTAFGYIVIAIVDRLFQQKNFTKQMMMTKDEVKREYKEMEGSQEIKQAQKQFRDEILNGPDPRAATKKADVVVTNPTHYAVGIRFRADEAPLPKVVVSGMDRVAKIIRETALDEGIPIMENVPLARSLYAKVKVDDFIPVELAEPVAEVLKWVKSLNDAKKEEAELDSIEL